MSKRKSTRLCIFSVVLTVVFVCTPVVIVTVRNLKLEHESNALAAPQTLELSGVTENSDDLDLRLNGRNKSCKEPTCIKCKAKIASNFEPLVCAPDQRNIINGSCYLCRGKCLTFQNLLSKSGEEMRCPVTKQIDCCILATMGNLINHCGQGNSYNCYGHYVHRTIYGQSVSEPICQCSNGSRTKNCQKPKTETAQCKCFKSERKFCGEEKKTHCDEVNSEWKRCYMNIARWGERYSCLCKLSDRIRGRLPDCTY